MKNLSKREMVMIVIIAVVLAGLIVLALSTICRGSGAITTHLRQLIAALGW